MPPHAPADLTQRFLLENLDIRGQVVRLGPLWRAILGRRDYPAAVRPLLAEFAAVGVLIGSGLKHPGRAVLQVMGHGPVQMAVADCSRELALRAMVRLGESYDPDEHVFDSMKINYRQLANYLGWHDAGTVWDHGALTHPAIDQYGRRAYDLGAHLTD